MASKAKALIALIFFWGTLGLIWSSLYDVIYTTIPNSFSYAVTNGSTTWEVLKYVWLIGMPIIAIGTGLSSVSQKNQYSLGSSMIANGLILVTWFITMFVWAAMYEPLLSLIPNAVAGFYSFETNGLGWLSTAYNSGIVIFMIGFAVFGVSIEI